MSIRCVVVDSKDLFQNNDKETLHAFLSVVSVEYDNFFFSF